MKHFALIVIAVRPLLGTAVPAMAKDRRPLYAVGDEPNASGYIWAKFASPAVRNGDPNFLKVSCSHLTPGETYVVGLWWITWAGDVEWVAVGDFVADSRGTGSLDWTRFAGG